MADEWDFAAQSAVAADEKPNRDNFAVVFAVVIVVPVVVAVAVAAAS